ncbi:MAG TPA: hypothetical protein VEP90_28065 [Methylomirabilota bacterium]|nr:hypothetical protein [Methylomirabilota bacterium]
MYPDKTTVLTITFKKLKIDRLNAAMIAVVFTQILRNIEYLEGEGAI